MLLLWVKFLISAIVMGISKGRAGLRVPEDRQARSDVPVAAIAAAERATAVVNADLQGIVVTLVVLFGVEMCLQADLFLKHFVDVRAQCWS